MLVGKRHVEPVAEFLETFQIQLLHLVGLVHRLTSTGGIAFYGLGQNHGGTPGVLGGLMVSRVHLERVMATTVEAIDVLVGHVRHQFLQLRIGAEEMLAGVGAAVLLVGLILTIHALFHTAAQQALVIFFKQGIPQTPPDHLDHIPAGTTEHAFQFLNDLAVTPYRAIQTLQVTVDHKHQVIQLLAAGQSQRTEGFRLVHLAIAHEGPHLAVVLLDQLAVLQVLHDVGLIDGLDRPKPHGHSGELPEIRHQPRVRVRRQTLPVHFPTEVIQLLFADTPFQIGPRIHARRRVTLKEHQIPFVFIAGGPEEMVEPHVIQGGRRSEGGNMATQFIVVVHVCPHHHGKRIPAHQGTDTAFHEYITGNGGFVLRGNGVEVGGVEMGTVDALFLGFVGNDVEKPGSPFRAFPLDH